MPWHSDRPMSRVCAPDRVLECLGCIAVPLLPLVMVSAVRCASLATPTSHRQSVAAIALMGKMEPGPVRVFGRGWLPFQLPFTSPGVSGSSTFELKDFSRANLFQGPGPSCGYGHSSAPVVASPAVFPRFVACEVSRAPLSDGRVQFCGRSGRAFSLPRAELPLDGTACAVRGPCFSAGGLVFTWALWLADGSVGILIVGCFARKRLRCLHGDPVARWLLPGCSVSVDFGS